MGWNDERVETLKKLHAEGLSTKQIAIRLGDGITRNAVIGKITRLGLNLAKQAPSKPRPRPMLVSPKVVALPPPPPRAKREAVLPAPVRELPVELGTATIHELEDHMCKWPIGDPAEDSFRFCGKRTKAADRKVLYCAEHERIAHPYAVAKRAKVDRSVEMVRQLRRFL